MIPFLRPSAWRPWTTFMALTITAWIVWMSKNVIGLGALAAILLLIITVMSMAWRIYQGRWQRLLWSRFTKEGFVDTSRRCQWRTTTIGLGEQTIWMIVGQRAGINYEELNIRFLPPFLALAWPETHESYPVISEIESLAPDSPMVSTKQDRKGIGRNVKFKKLYYRAKRETLWLKITLKAPCQIDGRISIRTIIKGHGKDDFDWTRCRIKVRSSHSALPCNPPTPSQRNRHYF